VAREVGVLPEDQEWSDPTNVNSPSLTPEELVHMVNISIMIRKRLTLHNSLDVNVSKCESAKDDQVRGDPHLLIVYV
jgi:hypothetical protein